MPVEVVGRFDRMSVVFLQVRLMGLTMLAVPEMELLRALNGHMNRQEVHRNQKVSEIASL